LSDKDLSDSNLVTITAFSYQTWLYPVQWTLGSSSVFYNVVQNGLWRATLHAFPPGYFWWCSDFCPGIYASTPMCPASPVVWVLIGLMGSPDLTWLVDDSPQANGIGSGLGLCGISGRECSYAWEWCYRMRWSLLLGHCDGQMARPGSATIILVFGLWMCQPAKEGGDKQISLTHTHTHTHTHTYRWNWRLMDETIGGSYLDFFFPVKWTNNLPLGYRAVEIGSLLLAAKRTITDIDNFTKEKWPCWGSMGSLEQGRHLESCGRYHES
jgi:hypothetical protein